MPSLPTNFGFLPDALADYSKAPVAVLPVPLERTVSWGRGTSAGPAAILRASQALELYDQELRCEPADVGISTLPPFLPEAFELGAALEELEAECRRHFEAGKFLITLGGEHSLTLAPVRAARSVFGELAVVQFDAHADLREEYEGTPYSHASVMRRIHDLGVATLPLGIRSLSRPEAEFAHEAGVPIVWSHELAAVEGAAFDRLLDALPDQVYLTFDVDFFDPSQVPATGTPEPGGGTWHPTLRLLSRLFEAKRVVAMDVVELAPIVGQPASDFLAAKLVYKCVGYWARHAMR
jgi:N1-aminopropylagmatine ureohydrolase